MPNWCGNTLIVRGLEQKRLEEFDNAFKGKGTKWGLDSWQLDGKTPEEVAEMKAKYEKDYEESEPTYSFDALYPVPQEVIDVGFSHNRKDVSLEQSLEALHDKEKWIDGYTWCVSHWGCYDEETEVLTDDGWKYFRDLKGDERFFTLNSEGVVELHKAERYIEKKSSEMLHFRTRGVDLLVTPEHRMLVKSRRQKKYVLIPAEEIPYTLFKMKRDLVWVGQEEDVFELPGVRGFNWERKALKIKMDVWLEFLGYFLSEGSLNKKVCQKGGEQYFVRLSQKEGRVRDKMLECVKRMPFTVFECGKDIIVSGVQLYQYLERFGRSWERFVPKELKMLSKRQLRILFEALMDGDGTRGRNLVYYTTSKQLADDVFEIGLKLGYVPTLYKDDRKGRSSSGILRNRCSYGVRFIEQKDGTLVGKPERVAYDGKVYCVVVPNHTLYVRRNGKGCWCGNTKWDIDGESISVGKDENEYTYHFSTAWAPPSGWLAKVAKDWTDLSFELRYEEGGVGFAGYILFEDGEVIEHDEVDGDDYRQFVIDYFDYDPYEPYEDEEIKGWDD